MKFSITLMNDLFLFSQCLLIYYLNIVNTEALSYLYSIG